MSGPDPKPPSPTAFVIDHLQRVYAAALQLVQNAPAYDDEDLTRHVEVRSEDFEELCQRMRTFETEAQRIQSDVTGLASVEEMAEHVRRWDVFKLPE